MGIRTVGRKGRYLVHGRDGKIIDNVDRGRSLIQDRKRKARTKVSSGYGHLGDINPSGSKKKMNQLDKAIKEYI